MTEKINESGYRRARELMEAGGNRDLTPMIKATASQETEWLEVKANPFMPAKDDSFYKDGENADYYEWTNLVKPLIALANFHGGVLLLGIKEDKEDGGRFKTVPLKDRNHEVVDEAGFDVFKNELAACFGKSKFEFKDVVKGKGMTYETTRPLGELISYEPHKAFYQGQLVLAIFVRVSEHGIAVTESSCGRHADLVPHLDKRGNDIYPTEERSKRTIYLVRCPGEQGRVEAKVFESDADLKPYRMRNIGAACKDRIKNYYGAISLIDADTFVGRVAECNAVSKILDEGKYPLISGGAGIGKTSVATKLAQKWVGACAQGCVVVKVDAEKMEKLEEAFLSGDFRRLIESQTEGFQWQNRSDATEVCKDVLMWLQKRGIKCLVIYDNIEDVRLLAPSEISRFCGYDGADHVSFCFVSRRHGALRNTGMVEPYELSDLSEKDALELLERRNPFQDAEEKTTALEIVRLPEVAGYRAWVLDIISARMASDEVPSYRYVLKELKRDLSGTVVVAGLGGDIMTPSMREGKSTVQNLLEPSLTIFDKKPKSLDLLLLSLFLPPDSFGRAEIAELYRSVFGIPIEENGEEWAHEFGEMIRPMLDRHIWVKEGDGFAMHRLTADGVRCKYGKEVSDVWAKIAAHIEKYVTAKIDLRRIPTVLSILSAASEMGFADDVKRLCLNTENRADSHFLTRAIEFCVDNCDLRGLIDSFRSEVSVAAIYMCAQHDVARNLTELRPVVDALMNIVDGRRPDDGTDALTWHYVALTYLLLGDTFSDRLSKNCAFGCYCNAVEIMHCRLGWDSHPDILRAVNRLYDVGRGCHEWSDEVARRVLELNEKPGASLDLAFRCRTEGDYEYAMLSDSYELQLHADVAEMDNEDGSDAVRAFVKARLNIALRWYQKCAEVLSEVGVGAAPCFLIECYMAEFYAHANSALRDYGGADDLQQESERRFEEIVRKYKLLDFDEVKDFCKVENLDGGTANAGGNMRLLRERLSRYVREAREGKRPADPDALDSLFDRLSVNSGDVANTYVYVENNYHWMGRQFQFPHSFDESVDLTEMCGIAQRFLFLLTRFLKGKDFECLPVCEFLWISGPEFRDMYHAIRPMNEDMECFLDSLIESCGVKGRMGDVVDLLERRTLLWASRGLGDYWRRDMETLGEKYYSWQNYKASLQIYDEINRNIVRDSGMPGYAYERCRCYELMNDVDAVRRVLQGSQDGKEYCQLLADMVELSSKHRLPRLEWYVKLMIELGNSKVEAIWAVLRETDGSIVRDAEKVGGTVSGNVSQLCEAVSRLYTTLKWHAGLHERAGKEGLCTQDKLEAERSAKLAIDLCTVKVEVWRTLLRAAGGFVVRNEDTGEESESGNVVRLYKELKSRAEWYERIGAKELCAKDNADAEKLAKEVRERLPGRFMIWMIDGL